MKEIGNLTFEPLMPGGNKKVFCNLDGTYGFST